MKSKQITSVQNPKIKAAARLKRGRGRKTQGRIVIYGFREVLRALQSGLRMEEFFLCPEICPSEELEQLEQAIGESGTPVFEMPLNVFAKLAYGERNDGVVATAFRPRTDLRQLSIPDKALVVVLESIEKPGNVGAVLRSADAVGADALILANPQCDPFHPNCIRASLGTVFTVPIASAPSNEVIEWCQDQRLCVFHTLVDADKTYTECDYQGPSALVFGNEAEGLSNQWECPGFQPISIPMQGAADSLNISVAAGIVLFEARRQRN